MKTVSELKIKIYADGANKASILNLYKNPYVKGFTTNPTLMRQAGVTDYEAFSRDILNCIPDRPISFEVFSDDLSEMYLQAIKIASWGENVYVKIPVSNSLGETTYDLIEKLAKKGIKQNVTALMTLDQVQDVTVALADGPEAYLSVFAGRIADTGRDPVGIMAESLDILRPYNHLELLWASSREVLNIFQADQIGCHIITITPDLLKKIELVGKDLHDFSLETVKMFREDAIKAGFTLDIFPTFKNRDTEVY